MTTMVACAPDQVGQLLLFGFVAVFVCMLFAVMIWAFIGANRAGRRIEETWDDLRELNGQPRRNPRRY